MLPQHLGNSVKELLRGTFPLERRQLVTGRGNTRARTHTHTHARTHTQDEMGNESVRGKGGGEKSVFVGRVQRDLFKQ